MRASTSSRALVSAGKGTLEGDPVLVACPSPPHSVPKIHLSRCPAFQLIHCPQHIVDGQVVGIPVDEQEPGPLTLELDPVSVRPDGAHLIDPSALNIAAQPDCVGGIFVGSALELAGESVGRVRPLDPGYIETAPGAGNPVGALLPLQIAVRTCRQLRRFSR